MTLIKVIVVTTVLLIVLVFDLKDIQYLGCAWSREMIRPSLCSTKKIKKLGCTWKIPSYMNVNEKDKDYRVFNFISDFGIHKIYFDSIAKGGPTSDITNVLEKKEDKGFIKRIYVTNESFSVYGVKEVHITRENYDGQVSFFQMDEQPYFLQCLASAD